MLNITEQWIYPTEDDHRNGTIHRQSTKTIAQTIDEILSDDRLYNLSIKQAGGITTITFNIFEGWCPKVIMTITKKGDK